MASRAHLPLTLLANQAYPPLALLKTKIVPLSHVSRSIPRRSPLAGNTSAPWSQLLFNYWRHVQLAREADPTGALEYSVHWRGPWGVSESSVSPPNSSLVALVSRKHEMPYCCTALQYGARIACGDGTTVEVVPEPAGQYDAVMVVHPISAHEQPPPFPLPRGPRVFHVVDTMEPPGYSKHLQTNSKGFMSHFDLGSGFSGIAARRRHVPQPYVLLRDGHHIFARLRLSFAERTEPRGVVFAVGNCGGHGSFPRKGVLKELMGRMPIDSIGSCLRSSNKSVNGEEQENKHLTRYKLIIALENSVCDGYITEKAMRAFRLQLVPVFYEAAVGLRTVPGYTRFFPNRSFINAADFSSIDALAAHLNAVMTNETLWLSYMHHRTEDGSALSAWQRDYEETVGLPVCRLARTALALVNSQETTPGGLEPIDCVRQGWPWQLGGKGKGAALETRRVQPPPRTVGRAVPKLIGDKDSVGLGRAHTGRSTARLRHLRRVTLPTVFVAFFLVLGLVGLSAVCIRYSGSDLIP